VIYIQPKPHRGDRGQRTLLSPLSGLRDCGCPLTPPSRTGLPYFGPTGLTTTHLVELIQHQRNAILRMLIRREDSIIQGNYGRCASKIQPKYSQSDSKRQGNCGAYSNTAAPLGMRITQKKPLVASSQINTYVRFVTLSGAVVLIRVEQ